jgi:putative two-component system response regulator
VGALLRVKTLLDQLERAENVITALGATIEARDAYTSGHCERLAAYAVALGRVLDVPESLRRALRLGGYLHDLGKIAVSDGILLKPGRLTPAERKEVNRHPDVGADLVRGLRTLDDVRPLIRHHHERWDGSGYPDGLRSKQIPLLARVLQVADIYDALTSPRPYKPAFSPDEALRTLQQETDRGWRDPDLVRLFLRVHPAMMKKMPTTDRSLHALQAYVGAA